MLQPTLLRAALPLTAPKVFVVSSSTAYKIRPSKSQSDFHLDLKGLVWDLFEDLKCHFSHIGILSMEVNFCAIGAGDIENLYVCHWAARKRKNIEWAFSELRVWKGGLVNRSTLGCRVRLVFRTIMEIFWMKIFRNSWASEDIYWTQRSTRQEENIKNWLCCLMSSATVCWTPMLPCAPMPERIFLEARETCTGATHHSSLITTLNSAAGSLQFPCPSLILPTGCLQLRL